MADVNKTAEKYVGREDAPGSAELPLVEEDAERCAVCGFWTWKDELDEEGSCEPCREGS